MTITERRKSSRHAARIPVRLGTGAASIEGHVHDICRDAVLVETGRAWPVDTELQLSMQLPGSEEPIEVKGRIVRIADGADGAPRGMAVLFTDVTPAAVARIDIFLEHQA